MFYPKFFIASMMILLFFGSARSQQPLRAVDESATEAVRKKAFDLLESLAGQVESLRSPENRARMRSNIAGSLWSHDEKRARSLFTLVEEDLKAGFGSLDREDPRREHTWMVYAQLRRDTIKRIAKHDPVLALQFLRTSRPQIEANWSYRWKEDENAFELQLATQIAAKNPDLALKLGRASLAKGVSPDLLPVLSRLRSQNKDAAASLFKEIVDKLKTTDLGQDLNASQTAIILVRTVRPPKADELIYRDLVGLILTAALESGCADAEQEYPAHICQHVGSVFPQLEKYYSSRAAPLLRWKYEPESGELPQEAWDELREVVRDGTINEILALSTKYPDMNRQVYWAAVRKAEASGDVTRARQLASEFPDEGQRREMLAQIDRDQMWKIVSAEKLAGIQQNLGRLRNNEQRIGFLVYMARQIGESDRKAALGLLNQAGELIYASKTGKQVMGQEIQRAIIYCSLKSDRGFSIMESLMPKLNELVTAAATLDGFENNYLRDGEWNMSADGPVGALLTTLAQGAGAFAWADFDRAVTLSSQLERPELRLMAHLKIAQGVLDHDPNAPLPIQMEESIH